MKLTIARTNVPTTSLFIERIGETDFGKHKPVAFILPGGPGADHTHYLRYACLQDVADILFHDPRGCGKSDKGDPSTYTMDNYIDDVDAIREQLGFEKIIVIGKSYGACCALGYALRYQDHVSQLVLAAGAPSYHSLETAKENLMRSGTRDQIKIAEKLWAGNFQNDADLLNFFEQFSTLYSVKARTKMHEFNYQEKSTQFSYEVLNEGFRNQFWHYDFEPQLSTIHIPTLVLGAREDWVMDVRYSELMASKIPNSQLKIFEEASHMMEIDATEDYFGSIRQFIKSNLVLQK